MLPGSVIPYAPRRAARRMRRCQAESPGGPVVCPRGKFTKTDRGGRTERVMSKAEDMEIVGIPASST